MDSELLTLILNKLRADGGDRKDWAILILAACEGSNHLADLVEQGIRPPEVQESTETVEPVGAYLRSLTVEGFRGIGIPVTLDLTPGPGLTLIVGRNGSGKSTLAEAIELLLTGDNARWAGRTQVWREGWRNLHHPDPTRITATLAVEGRRAETRVSRWWEPIDELDQAQTEVQTVGEPKAKLDSLGWAEPLVTYRPFLSYSELGALLEEGPTKLYDAVASILGLEELALAEKALRDVRLDAERAVKESEAGLSNIIDALDGVEDRRAEACSTAIARRPIDFESLEKLASGTAGAKADVEGDLLRRLSILETPDESVVDDAVKTLLRAGERREKAATTAAGTAASSALVLESALTHHAEHDKSATCPVCQTPGVIDEEWNRWASQRAVELRAAAREFDIAKRELKDAVSAAKRLLMGPPATVEEAVSVGINPAPAISAWKRWEAGPETTSVRSLADHLSANLASLELAVERIRDEARKAIAQREDAWRPIAARLGEWIPDGRRGERAAGLVPDLKKAEKWLKATGVEIRQERFIPIADQARGIWNLLRQQSSVSLDRVDLEGTGTRRRVALDVTIDGVDGAALGVMSQGELHALALSLFFPRATLDASPFRFLVIDDPVQSMDPSKVDGLARVLEHAAVDHQILVFTHDDRLPSSVRRLGIDARVVAVTRRAGSVVELRDGLDPVERYLEDARALVRTQDLPPHVAARVIPGFCREALEAACVESVRKRRLSRGEPHEAVEQLLSEQKRLTTLAALALFDDEQRGSDVLQRLNQKFGRSKATTFQLCNRGSHIDVSVDLNDLVRDAAILARGLKDIG
jgi:energy-coupling factor transporter ATP-binding protein EcfA2